MSDHYMSHDYMYDHHYMSYDYHMIIIMSDHYPYETLIYLGFTS